MTDSREDRSHIEAKARKFLTRFPVGKNLSVEQFDMFIIDHGLAIDPGPSDTKDATYQGFVGQRSQARAKLNRAAVNIDSPFQIEVVKGGEIYTVKAWSESSRNIATDLGNRVEKYALGRFAHLRTLHNAAERLAVKYPEDHDLQQTSALLSVMRAESVALQSKVKGIVYQYNGAADAVEKQVMAILDKYEDDNIAKLPAPELDAEAENAEFEDAVL